MGKLITRKTQHEMFECGNKNVKFSRKENSNFKANTAGRKTLLETSWLKSFSVCFFWVFCVPLLPRMLESFSYKGNLNCVQM